MKKLLLLLAIIASTAMYAQPPQPQIPSKYVKDKEKPVLVMFTANWCGPCQYMKREIFKKDNVAPKLKELNVLLFDVDTAEGKALYVSFYDEKIGVPKFVLLDKDQQIIGHLRGAVKAQRFAEFLDTAF